VCSDVSGAVNLERQRPEQHDPLASVIFVSRRETELAAITALGLLHD